MNIGGIDMDLKQLNNKLLLKRFREQVRYGRFLQIDIISELKLRGMEKEMNEIISAYKNERN